MINSFMEKCLGTTLKESVLGFEGSNSDKFFSTILTTGKPEYYNEFKYDHYSRGITYWDGTAAPIYIDEIVIKMFFAGNEHNPPHFHAIYGDYFGEFDIRTLEMLEGDMPTKALDLINEWGKMNPKELMEIWNSQQFKKLKPLE